MDASQWPQHHQLPMEDIPIPLPNNNNNNPNTNNPRESSTPIVGDQRKARPQKDQNINCPRCNSTNTKFCYYNNYSLTQPRYFCKTCRRYWTQGGSLRNVPVGGGSRKNKRPSSSSSSSSSLTQQSISVMGTNPTSLQSNPKLIPDLNPPSSLSHLISPSQNPKFLEGQDLNLAFPIQGIFQPNNENNESINLINGNTCSTTTKTTTTTTTTNSAVSNTPISALELLRTGMASRGSLNPFVPMPIIQDSNTLYPSGFPNLQDFKPNMNVFSPAGDHGGVGGGAGGGGGGGGARLLFPFADMNKLASTTTTHHHHNEIDHHDHDHDQIKGGNEDHHHHQGPTNGYWSGMLGGGTW